MALLVPTVGENKLIEFALGKSTPGDQILHLYVNNYTPVDGDTSASYTEMSTLGYAAKTLTKGSWTVAQNAGVAQATYADQTFTFTAGTAVTVYGYYVTDTTTGTLLWAEKFGTALTVQYAGDQIIISPTFTGSKT